ncbi:hypothetical protein FA95DRAFT_1403372 [Auriscalpium vulgare]|uniref:Uncharacterized protein n=1 Tax=Auriscalpium vulgare TaxID=40419 RepID=A0ACB8RRD3_9AGAM|nr:hypothetical protein FA95DRAFT_1403372 [Auriscalpium vulgare]
MKFMLALAALALAAPALAEAPSALPSRIAGFSPCILECLKHNEGPDGCTIGDVECSCTKPQYSSGVTMCVLNQGCSAADIEAASKVHQEDCAPYAARAVPSAISSGVASLPSGLPSCISKCLDISKGCEPGEVECSCNNPLYAHNVETCFSNCTSAERHIADKQHSSLCAPCTSLPFAPRRADS